MSIPLSHDKQIYSFHMVNINSVLYWQTSRTFCYDTCQHLFAMTHVSTFLLWHMSAPFAITHVSTFCYDTCQHLLLWHMSAPFCYDTCQHLLLWHMSAPFAMTHVSTFLLWHNPFVLTTIRCFKCLKFKSFRIDFRTDGDTLRSVWLVCQC